MNDPVRKNDGFNGKIREFETPDDYEDFKEKYWGKDNTTYMDYLSQLEQKYGTKDYQTLLGKLSNKEYTKLNRLEDASPMWKPQEKKNNLQKILENAANNVTLKLPDIVIGKSLGAKANNYEVMDLGTGEMFHFVEGSLIRNVEVFAGKGTKITYRNAIKYAEKYGGNAEDWQHAKGEGILDTEDGDRLAEVHWSQCEGIGKHDFFVKKWLDE